MPFANATVWRDRDGYQWGDMDHGPKHGPHADYHAAAKACRAHYNNPSLDVFASCPPRFRTVEPTIDHGFTQEMAETYGDNRD